MRIPPKKLKTFRVLETVTIVREGYVEAESLEKAEEFVNSDEFYDFPMEVTEEYVDNVEVWEENEDD